MTFRINPLRFELGELEPTPPEEAPGACGLAIIFADGTWIRFHPMGDADALTDAVKKLCAFFVENPGEIERVAHGSAR